MAVVPFGKLRREAPLLFDFRNLAVFHCDAGEEFAAIAVMPKGGPMRDRKRTVGFVFFAEH